MRCEVERRLVADCGSSRMSSAWPLNPNDRSPAGGSAKTLAALHPNRAHGGKDRQPGSGRPGLQLLLRNQRRQTLHQLQRRHQDVAVVVAPGRLQCQYLLPRAVALAGSSSVRARWSCPDTKPRGPKPSDGLPAPHPCQACAARPTNCSKNSLWSPPASLAIPSSRSSP